MHGAQARHLSIGGGGQNSQRFDPCGIWEHWGQGVRETGENIPISERPHSKTCHGCPISTSVCCGGDCVGDVGLGGESQRDECTTRWWGSGGDRCNAQTQSDHRVFLLLRSKKGSLGQERAARAHERAGAKQSAVFLSNAQYSHPQRLSNRRLATTFLGIHEHPLNFKSRNLHV